jgi:hypothetical protein
MVPISVSLGQTRATETRKRKPETEMEINITDTSTQKALGNDYLYVEMQCGKHSALVVVCRGATDYVQVIVQNAANRAWRGMGKRFANMETALNAYRTAAIRGMIQTACELHAA